MTKLLILVAAVVAIVWLLRRAFSGRPRDEAAQPGDGAAQGALVSCAHCGVNLPKAEVRNVGGRDYCSEEHGRLGPRNG